METRNALRSAGHVLRVAGMSSVAGAVLLLGPSLCAYRSGSNLDTSVTSRIINLPLVHAVVAPPAAQQARKPWHPPHQVKVWTTTYRGRMFRVTQLPRCEHLQTLITYEPSGETTARAKRRLSGVAAMTGSFHHPQTFALADFLQRSGAVYAAPTTGRYFLAMHDSGKLAISKSYSEVRGKPDVSALALGQRLVPLERDGFSLAFMNRVTDRMAIGMNDNFIYIVQGKSDIWRLAGFMANKLPVKVAVNSDGGHVVRGKSPVHVVFRWKPTVSRGARMALVPAKGSTKNTASRR